MHRETLTACAPYLGAIVLLLACGWLLLRVAGTRCEPARLRRLHRDETGAVQSLSFILTLPIFLMIMLFVVQLVLITMARISVEYAAFAAARSAVVWLPAVLPVPYEGANQVGPAPFEWVRQYEADGRTYDVYRLAPVGDKYERIRLAATAACMPISPSIDTGASESPHTTGILPSILRAYYALAPGAQANPRIPARVRNKWNYAWAATQVAIEVHHCGDPISNHDPPLYPVDDPERGPVSWYLWPYEIGWQDAIYVTVTHQYALLPGPGRLLARRTPNPQTGYDPVPDQLNYENGVYSRSLTATVRLTNEGQKSARPFIQPLPWVP